MGWAELTNGDLIAKAETQFDVIITTDKNWKYQQRITGRRIAILVLPTANWPELKMRVEAIVNAVNGAKPGSYTQL